MSLSTYQKVFKKEANEYIEKLTNYQEEGYSLKFPEYFIWRLIGAEIYTRIQEIDEFNNLDLGFIEYAIPDGEGEIDYLEPMFVKDQMELLGKCIKDLQKTGGISDEDFKLLENVFNDVSRFISLCDFCLVKDYSISIVLDA